MINQTVKCAWGSLICGASRGVCLKVSNDEELQKLHARMNIEPDDLPETPGHYLSDIKMVVECAGEVRASCRSILFHGRRWSNAERPCSLDEIWATSEQAMPLAKLVPAQDSLPDVVYVTELSSQCDGAALHMVASLARFFDTSTVFVEFANSDQADSCSDLEGMRRVGDTCLVRDPLPL